MPDTELQKLRELAEKPSHDGKDAAEALLALPVLLSRLDQKEKERISVSVFQHDWIPGFAAFHDDGQIAADAQAHVVLNLGSLLACVASDDLPKEDLPYMIAETLMHEVVHCLESWAKIEFSEDKVEELIEKYRAKYPPEGAYWQYDSAANAARESTESKLEAAEAKIAQMAEYLGFEGKQQYALWRKERLRAERAEARASRAEQATQEAQVELAKASMQLVQEKLVADRARESWEPMACGHAEKYLVHAIPGSAHCMVCRMERAESALAAERGRVIEECAKVVEKHAQQWAEFNEETIANEIRALATGERTTP